MKTRIPSRGLFLLLLFGCMSPTGTPTGTPSGSPNETHAESDRPPNVVLIFTDDQGYGDLSSAGHPTIHTPHIDRLAAGGRKFTQFYVASPVCSPSRAALLTGCYPKRVDMHEHVVFPQYDRGLHPDEVTLAEVLRAAGYATGCFGKWHLGHRRGMLPTDQGFDTWFGIPYSNDMAQIHRKEGNGYAYRLPLLRDEEVIEWEPDQRLLTHRLTEEAIGFIDENQEDPFFVYLPHPMPHIPLYASEEFEGRSPRGLYGDVIEEIDASVGSIVEALEDRGLLQNTLILFSSDNGPWLQFGLDGGSAGLLRGGKGTNWEGGQRTPMIAHWPGHIPPGTVCRELVTAMDLLPSVTTLTGASAIGKHAIDGHDASHLFTGTGPSPTEAFLYYTSHGELAGVRRGPWKLLLEGPRLFQVEQDVSERKDRAGEQVELVAELTALARDLDQGISKGARPAHVSQELVFDPRRPEVSGD